MASIGSPHSEKTLTASLKPIPARWSQSSILSVTSGSCCSPPITEDGHSEGSYNGAMVIGGPSRFKMCSIDDGQAEESGSGKIGNSVMVTQPGAARPNSGHFIAEETGMTGGTNSGSFKSKPLQVKIKKKHLRHLDVDKSKVWSKSHVKVGKDIAHVNFAIYPGITDPLHGSTHTSLLVIAQLGRNQRTEVEQRKTRYKIRVGCEASEDSELKFPEPLTVVFENGEDQVRYHQCLMSRSNLDLCSHDVITLTFNTTITMEPTQK